MDPLSITASILAIFDAGGKVGKGLKKLIRLKDAPNAFLALKNEATDLHCVVQDVDDLLRQRLDEQAIPSSITGALSQAKSTLLALDKMIAYDLSMIMADGCQKVDRSSWLRAERKVLAIREDTKTAKLSLTYALSLLSS